MGTKKSLCAILVICRGGSQSGRRLTWNMYRDLVLKTIDKLMRKMCYSPGRTEITLYYDNLSSHLPSLVADFLRLRGVSLLPRPPYSPKLALCDFWLFLSLKKYLEDRRFRSRCSIVSAICQYMNSVHFSDNVNAFCKLVKLLKLCITVKGEYLDEM